MTKEKELIKKIQVVFKNGIVKDYYNVKKFDITEFLDMPTVMTRNYVGEQFLIINYEPYSSTMREECYRLNEIASWVVDKGVIKEETDE